MIRGALIGAGLATAPLFLWAEGLPLAFPLACTLGETCYIQQYVDHDPGPGARDFTCGPLSYEGHKGTDFGLPTLADMRAGVTVLAAAPGVVAGLRDEMPDSGLSDATRDAIAGRECGNGVVIRHDGGWETQYCHMAQGSISVRSGQEVLAGTQLGRVGLSGLTEFPHLHLSVRRDGAVVDPFDPDGEITCGAPSASTLWADPVAYTPGAVLSAGFADAVPGYDAVKDGSAAVPLARTAPAMVLYGLIFGGREGDTVRIVITGPDGEVIAHDEPLTRTQAQLFRAAGKRAPRGGWAAGAYEGTVTLIRDGAAISSLATGITLDR